MEQWHTLADDRTGAERSGFHISVSRLGRVDPRLTYSLAARNQVLSATQAGLVTAAGCPEAANPGDWGHEIRTKPQPLVPSPRSWGPWVHTPSPYVRY
jgi:hypothetical protein